MSDKKVWIYDLEQLSNLHTATFVDRDSDEVRAFVIHRSRNDIFEYMSFLQNEVAGLIGFNVVRFDYPLLHFLMNIYLSVYDPDSLNKLLFEETTRLIREEYTAIPPRDVKIPQLDLFLIHHFDNKAKATSLKAVEIAINFPNVQDIPFSEDSYVNEKDIPAVLGYNLNDCLATKKFYFLSEPLVRLRQQLGKKYRLNLINHNDPKMGQEIFGRAIARAMDISYRRLRDLRTYRKSMDLKDCILPEVKFNSKQFNEILDFFKRTTIVTTYKPFEESVIYKGFKYDFGVGGLHGCIEPGVYESDENNIIVDIDVASYYPSLAIQNGFYPRHLGREFVDVYAELFDTRLKAKREGDAATNSGLKLALNGVYGKSNDQYSFFYDPLYTMKITINGQLMLAMLAESLVDNLRNVQILQVNTDGITIRIDKDQEPEMDWVCKKWEDITGMILEYATYRKMVIRDVNNYLAITFDEKAKPKGCFEIIPVQNGAIAYNKNWSMRVVPKALHAYYIDGIPVSEFIRNHDDIYDFCIGFRARGNWDVWATGIDNGEKTRVKQQKTLRYYMSNSGVSLTKENRLDGRVISLEAKKTATVFNEYIEMGAMEEYDINYNYYIVEANKIINAVDDGQLKMF